MCRYADTSDLQIARRCGRLNLSRKFTNGPEGRANLINFTKNGRVTWKRAKLDNEQTDSFSVAGGSEGKNWMRDPERGENKKSKK